MCWLKTMEKSERNVEDRERMDCVCFLTVSLILFKMSWSLTLFMIYCTSYAISLSTVKIDVVASLA